jgi:hypothetical protein
MTFRLWQVLRLGWRHERPVQRRGRLGDVVESFLRGLIVWPYIPQMKGVVKRNGVTYLAGGLFHLGLLVVIFLSRAHVLVWKELLGFEWPTLSPDAVQWLAGGALVAMVALFINRFIHPELRLLSGPAEWLNWLSVFLPMVTGFVMARRIWLPYTLAFSLHMLTVDFLLVWLPLSRLSHFLFYFFARAIHGAEFGGLATRSSR